MDSFFRGVATQATRWRILVLLAAGYAVFFGLLNNHHAVAYVLAVEVGSDRPDRVQIYFDDGLGYRETMSRAINIGRGNLEVRYVDVPAGGYHSLRLDPGDRGGDVVLGRAWVMNRAGLTLRALDLGDPQPNQFVSLERAGSVLIMRKTEPPPRPAPAIGLSADHLTPVIVPQAGYSFDPQVNFPHARFAARTPLELRIAIGFWHFAVAVGLLAGVRFLVLRAAALRSWVLNSPRTATACAFAGGALAYLIGNMSFDLSAWEPFNEPFSKWGWFLAQGHLDTPRGAFGAESMLLGGREHVYFGLWPAALRALLAPILGLEVNIGKRVLFGFAVAILLLTVLFVRHFSARTGLDGRSRDTAGMLAVFAVAGATVTPIFLARGYIYHEAIGWSAVAALAGLYALLKLLDAPRAGWTVALVVCAAVAAHSRATGLLGLAAACAAAGLWHTFARAGLKRAISLQDPVFNRLALAGLGFAGVAGSLLLVSAARFGAIGAFPLAYHYGHPIERLAHFGGTPFHLDNISDRILRYFAVPGLSFSGQFPYVDFLSDRTDRSTSDIIEPYLGVWALTGGLVLLAVSPWRRLASIFGAGGLSAVASGAAQILPALVVVGVTFRYHVEMLPALIVAIAGLAVATASSEVWRRQVAIWSLSVAALVGALLTVRFQNEIAWGAPPGEIAQYANLRGLTVREVYGNVLGEDFDLAGHFDHWENFSRYVSLADQTMASHEAELPLGAAVVHTATGIAMATPQGYCRAANAVLLSAIDAMGMDLGWYAGPMAAAAPCDVAPKFSPPLPAPPPLLPSPTVPPPAPGEFPLVFIASPITQPANADAYFVRFSHALAALCAKSACHGDPGPLSDRWHQVISARCAAHQCTILRRAQTNRFHGLIGVVLAVVRGKPIFFYVYEPARYFAPEDKAAEVRVLARLSDVVARSLAMNDSDR